MARRNGLALAAALVALVAVGWLAWPGPLAPPTGEPVAARQPAVDEPARPLTAPDRRSVAADPEATSASVSPSLVPGREDELTPRTAEVFGVVTDAETGQPIAGATVWGWSERVTTDLDGRYRIAGVELGNDVDLWAAAEGFAEGARTFLIREPSPTRVDFALRRGVPLTVEVFDAATGAPVRGAELLLFRGPDQPGPRTDDEGRVVLRVADGDELRLSVRADGYCSFGWAWDVADPAAHRPRIPMLRWAWIEGTVRGPDGQPLQAVAYAVNEALDSQVLELTSEQRAAVDLPGRGQYEVFDESSEKADEQGRFRLGVIPCPEPYIVKVTDAEHASSKTGPVLLASPGDHVTVSVQLDEGAVIRGRAVHNGESWNSGQVEVFDADGVVVGRSRLYGKGEYELRCVPAGSIRLRLRDWGGGSPVDEVTLRVAAGQEYGQDFIWETEVATIVGRVTDASGSALTGVRVHAYSGSPEHDSPSSRSGEDGRYVLEVRPSLTYTVTARKDVATDEREGVPAGARDVDLVLPPIGKLRLRLLDAASGDPVTSFGDDHRPVGWRTSGEQAYVRVKAELDIQGILELELPVGRADLSLRLADAGYALREILDLPVEPEAGEPVVVELVRGVKVTLTFAVDPQLAAGNARTCCTFLLESSELGSVRGPFPQYGAPSNMRVNEVNLWLREQALVDRLVHPGEVPVEVGGLAPGRYSLRSFPDSLRFEPESFEVGDEDLRVEVRWGAR